MYSEVFECYVVDFCEDVYYIEVLLKKGCFVLWIGNYNKFELRVFFIYF